MEVSFIILVQDAFMQAWVQVLMFFLSGIALELFSEFVKATFYPTKTVTAEDGTTSEVEREVPRWLGFTLGVVNTVAYLIMAYSAYGSFGDKGCLIPGGFVFFPVWAILFYFWQYAAIRVSKWICRRMFPSLKYPDRPKVKKEKVDDSSEMTYEQAIALLKKSGITVKESK